MYKFVMRTIGAVEGAISPDDFSEYLEYNFVSKGYKLLEQYTTPVYGADGEDVVAVKYWLTFVKDEEAKGKESKK